MENCAPVCILPHGFGSCLGSLKHHLSGVACRAVNGIGVSIKTFVNAFSPAPIVPTPSAAFPSSASRLCACHGLSVSAYSTNSLFAAALGFRPLSVLFQHVNEHFGHSSLPLAGVPYITTALHRRSSISPDAKSR